MEFSLFDTAMLKLNLNVLNDARGTPQFKRDLVEVVKRLIRYGIEEVEEEHQKAIAEKKQAIDERDTQIAVLNDALTETERYGRQLEKDVEEHQKAIAEKQEAIDVLNDELTETEEYGRQLEHDNTEQ